MNEPDPKKAIALNKRWQDELDRIADEIGSENPGKLAWIIEIAVAASVIHYGLTPSNAEAWIEGRIREYGRQARIEKEKRPLRPIA